MVTPISIYPSFETMRGQLGKRWSALVEYVAKLPVTDPYVMALTLTMRRIQKRLSTTTSTTCREPLCPACASDIVTSFPGTEQELLEMYYRHVDEISSTLKSMQKQQRPVILHTSAA